MITTQKQSLFGTKWLKSRRTNQGMSAANPALTQEINESPNSASSRFTSFLHSMQNFFSKTNYPGTGYHDPIRVETELVKSGRLGDHSAMLGVCEDGLPFVLDFDNPAPGSLLIAGDAGSGKSLLIRSLLDSASRLTQPGAVQVIHAVEAFPAETPNFVEEPPLEKETATNQTLSAQIASLTSRIEYRKRNPSVNPPLIFVINDLNTFLNVLDKESLSAFLKVVKHGPRYRVWTIAGFTPGGFLSNDAQVFAAFRTHIICGIQDRRLASSVSGDHRLNTRRLVFGRQFYVPYGEQWLRSWIIPPVGRQEVEVGL